MSWQDVTDWVRYDLPRPLRRAYSYLRYDVPHGIRNVVYWFPIVWRWRAWDHAFLLDVMVHALKAMEERHRTHGHFLSTPQTIRQLQIARHALEAHDGYDDMQWLDFHESEEGEFFGWMTLSKQCPFGTKKAMYKHEAEYKRGCREIFARQFVRHLEHWWE